MIKPNSIKYLKADFVMVVKTKFPFFEFFYQLMGLLLQIVKIERSKSYIAYKSSGELESFAKRYDHRYLLRILNEQINPFLDNLAYHKSPSFEKSLIINWVGYQINLFVPEQQLARYLEPFYGIQTVVANTSWLNFYTLFVSLLLEKNLVFVHEDRETISKYM